MADPGTERRLAAILSADVAGYSRLVAADDAGTLRRVAAGLSTITRITVGHGGRVVDARGDNLLAEFSSATQAVKAAVAAQTALETTEDRHPEEDQVRFRMGVHLGEVVGNGDAIAGDAVNIAARLQELARPGRVCVSGVVAQQASRSGMGFEFLGERRLKNIPGKVPVHEIRLGSAPRARALPGLRRVLTAAAAALIFATGTVIVFGRPSQLKPPATARINVGTEPFGVPPASIAVLPFANLSSDPDQEYFSDGLTEEVITHLAAMDGLHVVARTSSFAFKGRGMDVRRIGAELGVRTVLEGSVRREGRRLRVTVQLIQAGDGFHLWAESYERDLSSVFAIQQDIASAIAGTLATELAQAPEPSAPRPTTEDLLAYELYLRARRHWLRFDEEGARASIATLERALERDPQFASAWAALADSHTLLWDHGYDWNPSRIEKAEESARRAVALRPGLAEGHEALAWVLTSRGEAREARFEAERAIALRPGSARPRAELAQSLVLSGDLSQGIVEMGRAAQLDPLSAGVLRQYGRYLLYAGKVEEALAPLWRSLELNPTDPLPKIWLWETYHQGGQPERALEALLLIAPRFVRPQLRTSARIFGERRTLRWLVNGALLLQPGRCGTNPYGAAFWLAWSGDEDRMFECLLESVQRKAVVRRTSGQGSLIQFEPIFEPYREDPRFAAVLQEVRAAGR